MGPPLPQAEGISLVLCRVSAQEGECHVRGGPSMKEAVVGGQCPVSYKGFQDEPYVLMESVAEPGLKYLRKCAVKTQGSL